MIGVLLGKARGEHWVLSPAECGALGQSSANFIRHFPIDFERAGIVVDGAMLIAVTGSVVMPRLEIDRQVQVRLAEEAAERERQQQQARFGPTEEMAA